jgi:putative NADH-flavin reductase
MKIILFGATGMVGQGVLRECLLDPAVSEVLSIVRSTSGTIHAKLKEIVHADLFNLVPMEASLRGYDVCFFSIGVSAVGLSEKEYSRWNMELPVSVAQTLVRINPQMTFIYVSGQGTNDVGSSEGENRKRYFKNAV